ncbi:monocarboxylate transporter 10-like [Babylonia areolata]|uniref:monocarboxylate transporter 10-like n=1 Tax=Babylonia areolata TaxID=304850 RepID=UPI003FD0F719
MAALTDTTAKDGETKEDCLQNGDHVSLETSAETKIDHLQNGAVVTSETKIDCLQNGDHVTLETSTITNNYDCLHNGDLTMAEEKEKEEEEKEETSESPPDQFVHPEGGWGWVVCLTSMCSNGTMFGSLNTFGILYVALVSRYPGDDTYNTFKTSWVGSVCSGLCFMLCIAASILSDRFGIRIVSFIGGALAFAGMLSSAFVDNVMMYYLTYGVMIGTGFALVYSPSLVILGHYFKRRMGLVNGLVTFGSAAITIVYSLVLPILLEKVDLKYTLLCLSGMVFLLMPYSLTWKPLVTRTETETTTVSQNGEVGKTRKRQERKHQFLNPTIWHSRGYVVWVIACAVALIGYFVPFTHLVKHTEDTFPGSDGHLLPMIMSTASGLSRIVFGVLADIRCLSLIRMEQVAFFVMGVSTLCIPFAGTFTGLIVICLVMGVCDGLVICLLGPIAFDLVGESGASQAIGFLLGIVSFPMTLGPPLAGVCYDKLGSYKVAFHTAGGPSILGALLLFLIPRSEASATAESSTRKAESQKNGESSLKSPGKVFTVSTGSAASQDARDEGFTAWGRRLGGEMKIIFSTRLH